MQRITYQNNLTVEGEFGGALTENWQLGVVAKECKTVGALVVRDKCQSIWQHDIGCAGVGTALVVIGGGGEDAGGG